MDIKSESIGNITAAIIKVMQSVKGIDKTMTVGTGQSSYKGVPDQEVKKLIGDAMAANGLAIVPIGIDETCELSQWDEVDPYSKTTPPATKRKQSMFSIVKTKYLLMHVSGEWLVIAGFGHGVDSQDKGAGKATTYALKYALLYTFMVPTGKIDDSDNTHSDDVKVPSADISSSLNDLVLCTTKAGVKDVWDKYPQFQKNQQFINEVTKKKNECN